MNEKGVGAPVLHFVTTQLCADISLSNGQNQTALRHEMQLRHLVVVANIYVDT
jgi:hypothetical protein